MDGEDAAVKRQQAADLDIVSIRCDLLKMFCSA